jgi:hypothetical protein
MPLRFICMNMNNAHDFKLRINPATRFKHSTSRAPTSSADIPPLHLSIETLAAKSHALCSASPTSFPCSDPPPIWREKRRALQSLAATHGGEGLALCASLLQQSADRVMGARAQDMSKVLTVEVLEARAEAVQHVSYDQLLKAPVSCPGFDIT